MERMRYDLARMLRDTSESGRFPPPGSVTDRLLPAIRGEFRVDVRQEGGEMIVTADLPGAEKEDIAVGLVSPRALEISCKREENAGDMRGFYVRERIPGPVRRIVELPAEVTEDDASAGFTNGVLVVRLKIIGAPRRLPIAIE